MARSVCWRSGTSRAPDVSTSSAWSSRSSSPSGDRSRSRAAASSSASGRPSSRAADRRNGFGVLGRQPERALRRGGAVDEESDSRRRHERLDRVSVRQRRELERGERVLPFGGDPQRRPAGGHDPQLRATLDEPSDVRSRRHDLLQVVEEQKRRLVADEGHDPLAERPSLGLLHVERLRERRQECLGLVDVGHRDERDAVEELGRQQPAELDHGPGLPDTAGTGDRDDPMFPHELDERRQIDGTADQRRRGVGQVAREAREPLALALQHPRVRHDDAVGGHRVELERAPDVLEPEPPQPDDLYVAPVLDLVVRGVGQHHATGHRERLDPGRDVHGFAGEPLRLDDHLADMDADSHRNVLRRELLLDRDSGQHRSQRARKHAHAPVAEPLDDRPAEGVVMTIERRHIPISPVDGQALVRLDQRRVPDHVGEHHRGQPAIEPLAHEATIPSPRSSSSFYLLQRRLPVTGLERKGGGFIPATQPRGQRSTLEPNGGGRIRTSVG